MLNLHRRRPPGRAGTAAPQTAAHSVDSALAGYRLMRRLAAGERADLYLAVVDDVAAEPTGEDRPAPAEPPLVVMRVYGPGSDDDAITNEIDAMESDRTGTLPKLIDVANVADGRGCLVVERIAGRPLSEFLIAGGLRPGQVVTVLAPIIVALRALADQELVHARLAASDVLIDASGRPRLLGLGALRRLDRLESASDRVAAMRDGHGVLLRLIEDAAAASTDRAAFGPVLELARAALVARPFRRVEAELERALFAVAPPAPVLAAIDRPTRAEPPARVAEVLRGTSLAERADDLGVRATESPGESRSGRLAALAQLPPSALDDLATALDADARVRAVRRAGEWARRRRPALVAAGFAGTAALVALLTAIPPSSGGVGAAVAAASAESETAADGAPAPRAAGAEPASTPSATPRKPDAPDVPDDAVAAAAALLEIRHTCIATGDRDCVLAVDQPGSPIAIRDLEAIERAEPADPMELDLDGIAVAADLGDAVVLRVPWMQAEREPASLLMMRSEAGWRLREWFD